MADIAKVHETVAEFFEKTLSKRGQVVGVEPSDEGFRAYYEAVEEDEYMKKIGRDEIVATYEVELNAEIEVQCYRRRNARSRSEIPESSYATP